MKKTGSAAAKRGPPEGGGPPAAPPEKVGWVRRFCGKGIFRELWKQRYVALRGEQLVVADKEVKDEKTTQEVFDLNDYEKCEELRKSKSRSKKNHSKFLLTHSKEPGNTAPNLVFLAVSPEEKESWINALNSAITRAKNRVLDEVTVEEESCLAHPTRDRAKIQHSRRPPTRGHLMAVASTSTSDGMLTLDLIQEEDASPEDPGGTCEETFRVDLDKSVAPLIAGRRCSDSESVRPPERGRTNSLPRREAGSRNKPWPCQDSLDRGTVYTPQVPKRLSHAEKSKCASMEEILSCRGPPCSVHRAVLQKGLGEHLATAEPEQLSRIQELVALKLEKTQELLAEVKGLGEGRQEAKELGSEAITPSPSKPDTGAILQESERLLGEATAHWNQAQQVLRELRELRDLYKRLESHLSDTPPRQTPQLQHRKSLM